MKVIELLNKIANDEEVPKKVRYEYKDYAYKVNYEDYYCEEESRYLFEAIVHDENWKLSYAMNIEVEIIKEPQEHKIPEKLPEWATRREDKEYTNQEHHILVVARKVDEILDYLEEKQ